MQTSIAPTTFVGLDVHQDSISVALLRPGAQLPDEDQSANTPEAVRKLVRHWKDPAAVRACYEAGPTGYGPQRTFATLGVDCSVIAPGLIPVRPGSMRLAARAGSARLVRGGLRRTTRMRDRSEHISVARRRGHLLVRSLVPPDRRRRLAR